MNTVRRSLTAGLTAALTLLIAAPALPGQPGVAAGTMRTAIFAGGCFWCMEEPFEQLIGVLDVRSGFAGGRTVRPNYDEVTRGGTGHAEVVQVTYDPARVSYATLLEIYWRNVDPFDAGGQFCDRGDSYRPEIFVASDEERELAEQSKGALEKRFGRSVAVRISPAAPFYEAEAYHQDYHSRNPLRYRYYRSRCGRDARLEEVWGAEARGERVTAARRAAD